MTTVARHAYATLALSAKLHKLLDSVSHRRTRPRRGAVAAFEERIAATIDSLPANQHSPHQAGHHGSRCETGNEVLSTNARIRELTLLRRDLEELETIYAALKRTEGFSDGVGARFDELFAQITAKLNEKEARYSGTL